MSPTKNWSGGRMRHVGTGLAVVALLIALTLAVVVVRGKAAQDIVTAAQTARLVSVEQGGQNLSMALDTQRAQFEACKDAKAGTLGCFTAVTPPAKDVAPQIVTGSPGAQGWPGKDGANGLDGTNGKDGANGLDGLGKDGANGINGTNGADGAKGDTGSTGSIGPAGPPCTQAPTPAPTPTPTRTVTP